MIDRCRPATCQLRTWRRLRAHLLADLLTLGRHTITARILTSGGGTRDWSADYRLYALRRFDPEVVFSVVREHIEAALPRSAPLLAAVDDTILRKKGLRIPGVSYRRDPMGPPFQVNLVRALRVLQISAIQPGPPAGSSRAIPIDFVHAPAARKPSPRASDKMWQDYRRAAQQANLNNLARQRIEHLRKQLNSDRPLWILCDGCLTNRRLLAQLPERTVAIGRLRRDAKLYHLPGKPSTGAGRRRIYGSPAPTPEQLRKDPDQPWQTVSAFACGRTRNFRIKTLAPIRWRATSNKIVRIIVVAPLKFRLRPGSPHKRRQPAHLICTDPSIPAQQVLQAYLRRWDIEVNFRDEKTLLGAAHPQVRNPHSVQNAPALTVAAYALLLTAASDLLPQHQSSLPVPKWRRSKTPSRPSTLQLIQRLRHELWADAIQQRDLSHFTSTKYSATKSLKFHSSLSNAVFYASG